MLNEDASLDNTTATATTDRALEDDEALLGSSTTASRTAASTDSATAAENAAASGYMIRAEERLVVGKETVSAGVAELNKYVTSEHVYTTVPVSKEHAILHTEPITEADGIVVDAISEAHFEMPLTEERAVATKKAVAVEKVMLTKGSEQSTDVVGADLKKENVSYEPAAETAAHINIRK